MTVYELYHRLTESLPEDLALAGDKNGIMCMPDASAPVSRVLFALDVTEDVLEQAVTEGYDLIISHHPLLFSPIDSLTSESSVGRILIGAARAGISIFSFHTIADSAEGGVNDIAAGLMHLTHVTPFGGERGMLGRVGLVEDEPTLDEFVACVKDAFSAPAALVTDAGMIVNRVAVIGGAGKSFINDVLETGADTFVTGELSHSARIAALAAGLNLVEIGHFHSEEPVCGFFAELVKAIDSDIDCNTTSSLVSKFI